MFNQAVLFDILVLGGFFLGSKSAIICQCNHRLRSVCVGPSDPVFVPCPALVSEDFTLQLLQNQTVISSFCSPHQSSCDSAPVSSRTNQTTPNPAPVVTNQSSQLGFTVTVWDRSSHGVYACEGKSNYPPPVRKEAGFEQVLVLVRGHQCELKVDSGPDPVRAPGPVLVWIIAVVFLSIYSLLISIVCALFWVKSRRSECERDYVNTKPPHRRQRKKRREIHVII